jgi:hypothetical protein
VSKPRRDFLLPIVGPDRSPASKISKIERRSKRVIVFEEDDTNKRLPPSWKGYEQAATPELEGSQEHGGDGARQIPLQSAKSLSANITFECIAFAA